MKYVAAILLACLASTGTAAAMPLYGVSDDRGKYDADGGAWFFDEMRTAGLTANKMTVNWDPARPTEIVERAFLDRAIPEAERRGIHLSFGIHIGKARAITGDPRGLQKFTAWLRKLATTYPQITEYVVGNEPNLTRFWQPQFNANGSPAAGIAFARFLAASYDTLKDVNPEITVVGVGLSPRGNDMPNARSNVSRTPVRFIRDLGIGYRRLQRDKPIMDVFGFHPYPRKDRDSLAAGYRWPNAGIANLDRIKQAIWDAFHGTAQPTFAEPGLEQEQPLTFKLDEVGWQVTIPRQHRRAYFGRENVRPTDERTQARIYAQLVRKLACDHSVRSVLFFGLVDEPNLDRWQAALIRANRTRRPSWSTVRTAVRRGCSGRRVVWEHTEEVVGADVERVGSRVRVWADEDATVEIGSARYVLRAYKRRLIPAPQGAMVWFTAAMNPERFIGIAADE